MKRLFQPIVLLIPILLVISCKKEASPNNQTINSNNPSINTSPRVNAGKDITLKSPVNSVILRGIAFDDESNIASYEWTKIQGPAKYTFSTPHLPETIVSDLQKGTYVFELTVRDSMGLSAKDKVSVNVIEIQEIIVNPSEIIFTNLEWACFGQCFTGIDNIDSFISPNTPIKVYIKRDTSPDWIPVIEWTPGSQVQYTYWFEDFQGIVDLWIMNLIEDGSDTPDVKIIF